MDKKINILDFSSPIKPTWCPGCGNFTIMNALKKSLIAKGIGPTDVVLVFDIGCNGNGADKMHAYSFKGLHGRVIPVAAGIKLANQNLPVIAISGDGATLDEGIHHFIHAFRNNYDITFLLHNNENFALTTGQETPTTPKGQLMPISPWGVVADRQNPLLIALASGATFVASTWTGNQSHIQRMISEGISHKGFSFINIYQHCPTYNKFEDLNWLKDRIHDVGEESSYDNTSRIEAMKISQYSSEKRAIDIIYRDEVPLPYMKRIEYRQKFTTNLIEEVKKYNVEPLMEKFK